MAKENLKAENPVKKSDHSSNKPPRPAPSRSEPGTTGPASSASLREITSGSERSSSMRKSSPSLLGWPIKKAVMPRRSLPDGPDLRTTDVCSDISDLKKQNLNISEMEMMKERFAKLLLGEDMSGSGKGVCTALAISNAITNLCATIFGQLWRLEPLPAEKKSMWKREMEWLLCVSDHIVELIPTWQTFSDGSKLEVMSCRPRTDIFINLPALRKLDNMLLDILDSFKTTDFWYVDQGVMASDCDGSSSFRKTLQRQEEKWWLPVPRVPPGGLPENSRKQLDHKRECANQILKAAVAINSSVLADMEIPESFLEALPKNGRACLGDMIYRYITSEHFSPDCLLDCLDLSSDHVALEIANRVEAAVFVWRRRHHHHHHNHQKPIPNTHRTTTKSSWEMVKDLMVDGDKRELLAERAERLLLCLKQRCPGLSQTALDTSKIQCNKDVGRSILESYSRVLESLAFNIAARIDDLLYVDDLTKSTTTGKTTTTTTSSLNCQTVSVITTHKKKGSSLSVPISSTPCRTSSSSALVSPARGSRTQYVGNVDKPARRGGLGVRRVLTNYLGGDTRSSSKGSSDTQQQTMIKGSKSLPRSSIDNNKSSLSSSLTSSPAVQGGGGDKENADPQNVVSPVR